MCLIAFAWRGHPRYPLVLIANRDELHARPAAPADVDPEAPEVYGGRDLVEGGSWLQVSIHGRLAAVTNVRTGLNRAKMPRSRGWLVRDFVRGAAGALDFAAAQARAGGNVVGTTLDVLLGALFCGLDVRHGLPAPGRRYRAGGADLG